MSVHIEDVLLAYSEWLDGEKLIVGDKADQPRPVTQKRDERTHDELVNAFVDHWMSRMEAPIAQAIYHHSKRHPNEQVGGEKVEGAVDPNAAGYLHVTNVEF